MSKSAEALITTIDVKKDYESGAGRLSILKGIRFSLFAGQMALIFGKSGSGKSTFLHLLGGLDHPTSGKIIFEGQDITQMSEWELAKMRNRRLGYVFQFYHLLPDLTLYENVLLPSRIAGIKDETWAREVLRRVKLLSRKDHYPSQLSGGEQQRAAIARALVNRPAVVLCDEPTGNLDEGTAEEVIALLNDLNRQEGQSFLIVTHDESLAWTYGNSFRLHEGILLREKDGPRENDGPVKIEKIR
ncbi:MAG: ABC transporter ATP-binding protein [Candidatus Omnitrophica bacterium]|nr:ABC transporter ATP-binding protein [Candidatus Omnitrophota bacterium]